MTNRTIHILHHGAALCGAGVPRYWTEPGHVWMSVESFKTATHQEILDCCARCDKAFQEQWPKDVHWVVQKPLGPVPEFAPLSDLEIAERLWKLLDDISTLSDICKGNYEAFHARAYALAELRNQYLVSKDGQTLERERAQAPEVRWPIRPYR